VNALPSPPPSHSPSCPQDQHRHGISRINS
jgi:hypothetical protein